MGSERTEACGRCSMTSMVDVANADRDDAERAARDPFAGDRIEVSEAEMRVVAGPQILLGRVKDRLDTLATELVYGR